MIISVTREEIEEAILTHIFAKTGLNLDRKDCNIVFVEQDYSDAYNHRIDYAEVHL